MISRNLEKVCVDSTVPAAPDPHQTGAGKYLKSIVYGGLDGIITTFAVVTGVAGASLEVNVILILGAANLFADGIAMAFGDFLSTKAENEYHDRERQREEWEYDNEIDKEKKELHKFYREKGVSDTDTAVLVKILSKYKTATVDMMMTEELGLFQSNESPLGNALATFFSFVIFGTIPLLAYLVREIFSNGNQDGSALVALPWAIALTGLTLFTLGAVKTRFTGRSWIRSGMEMLFIGGIAAAAAYGIGAALEGLVGKS